MKHGFFTQSDQGIVENLSKKFRSAPQTHHSLANDQGIACIRIPRNQMISCSLLVQL